MYASAKPASSIDFDCCFQCLKVGFQQMNLELVRTCCCYCRTASPSSVLEWMALIYASS